MAGPDRGQASLLPPAIDDYVAEALARVVDAFVASLDLGELVLQLDVVSGSPAAVMTEFGNGLMVPHFPCSRDGVMMGTRIVVSTEWVEMMHQLVRAGVHPTASLLELAGALPNGWTAVMDDANRNP